MMKKMAAVAGIAAVAGSFITGCASSGLSKEASSNVPTKIWYDNANLLVDCYDPDMKADSFIGVPALDAVVDSVKDILVQVPAWTVTKVEQMHFDNAYMEAAKAVNSGADGADIVVKGQAFKTTLLMDTYAQEAEHAKAAVKLSKEEKKANYEMNESVYQAAVDKVVDYANNQIYSLETCADDAARNAFYADPARAQWSGKTDEIAAKIKACIAKSNDEAAAKAGIAKLCKEMGVQEVDWKEVGQRLAGDLEKIVKASKDFAFVLQSDTDLQTKMAKAAFGGEIVQGISGKETLAVIERIKKQFAVNGRLLEWLIKSLAV